MGPQNRARPRSFIIKKLLDKPDYTTNRMKYIKLTYIILPMLLLMAACHSGSSDKQGVDPDSIQHSRMDDTMERTAADTTAVQNLALAYFRALQDKEFDAALGLLYSEKDDGSMALSDDERRQVMIVYNSVPVYDYYITDLRMYGEEDTEVTVRVEMFVKQPGDNRPNYIDYKLNPRRIDGTWKLSVPVAFKETGDSVNNYDRKDEQRVAKSLRR